MTERLEIRKGGKLIEIYWDSDAQDYKEKDITDAVISKLWDNCTLASDVTLKDIFLLLNTELDIFDAVIGNWCIDIVTEGLTQPEKPYNNQYDSDEIEYLELQLCAYKDEDSFYGYNRPDFHGVGFKLKEDQKFEWGETMYPKGERIPWGISFTPACELINIPVKLDNKFVVYNEDITSPKDEYCQSIIEFKNPFFTLSNILYGIIWELSFHGGPKSRDKHKEEVYSRVNKIKELEKGDKND